MAEYSIKDISVRIRNIENTQRVTKAMELIASSKSRKAKARLEMIRPFIKNLSDISKQIFEEIDNPKSIYVNKNKIKKPCYIVIGGDRGFAGGYNSSVIKTVENNSVGEDISIIPIGVRIKEDLKKSKYKIISQDLLITENISFNNCSKISETLIESYLNNKIDGIYIVYTEFISSLRQIPRVVKILPLDISTSKKRGFILCEPGIDEVLEHTVPYYLSGMIWGAVCEGLASEHAARHTAMEAASKNASEIIDDLKLIYNQLRQSVITREIIEIVSGS